MNPRWSDYAYIASTIALTVLGQLLLKWRMDHFGPMPAGAVAAMRHLFGVLMDPFVIAAFVAAFGASLAWMAAMTRFELSYAYPFTSLNFIVVLVLSVAFLGETLTVNKAIGVALIVAGTLFVGADARAA